MQLRSQVEFPGVGAPPPIDEDIWKPVRKSLGSRDPALRSRYSSTGFLVEDDRIVSFESRLEKFAGEVFALDQNIVSFVEQPPRVEYLDGTTLRHHTFDFYTVRRPVRRTFVAIKHSRRVESSGIRRVIRLISEQSGRAVADEIVLMTELDFSASERFNAELVHETRRHPIPEHDLHVQQVSAEIQGIVTLRDIVAISGLGGDGFRAVVRLIADRFFELAAPDTRIDYSASIRRR
jgi:hypothetical protein